MLAETTSLKDGFVNSEVALAALLESCSIQLLDSQGRSPIPALMTGLDSIRRDTSNAAWRKLVTKAREHDIFKLLMHDPCTARGFQKPRGYAGDAVMLDYIYGRRSESSDSSGTTSLGRAIQAYTAVGSAPAKAVRWRRDWIASEIEAAVLAAGRPVKLLSFACGHLREYESVHSLLREHACAWTAADQDHESLTYVRRSCNAGTVTCSATSVRTLLNGLHDLKCEYDLVYSLGLFDYLSDRMSTRVMGELWKHLATGGRLIVANFSPANPGSGYMEMFMDWWLLYRSSADLERCALGIPESQIESVQTMSDPQSAVHYLTLTRR